MIEGMLWGPRPSNSKTKKEQVGSLTNILKDISNSLAKMKSSFEKSAAASRGNSPLHPSLAKLVKSTVSFNEKTLRWHDDQTHFDPRVQAKLTPKAEKIEIKEDKKATEKKTGLGVLTGFLEEITTGSKLSVHFLQKTSGFLEEITTGMKLSVHFLSKIADGGLKDDKDDDKKETSAEDESEDDADKKKGAKNAKKQTSFLKGMWESMKEKHKDNWLVKHWGKLLAFFLLLNTKMSTLVMLWEDFIKPMLSWIGDNPIEAAIAGLVLYFTGGAFASAIAALALKKSGQAFAWAGSKIKDIGKTFLQKRGVGMAGHMTDAQKKMTQTRMAGKGQLISQKLGRAAGKTKVVAKRVASSIGTAAGKTKDVAVKVAKSAGTKIGSMAQSTKGIFGSIVKKFGSAGRWIMKLGSKLIMPLVTTPLGWAILAGLAIGGLAYVFWDDIKAIWDKSVAFISDTFKAISEFASSMVGGARTMLGNFLRSVGAGMIADWIDPDGADKSKPAKEFTFGNLMEELGSVVKGLWKKIIGYFIDAGKAVKGIAASVARGLGLDAFADWIEKPDEPEPPKEFETTASGEKVEKTGVAKRKKWKKDIKARGAAEEAGFIETSMWTGSVEGLTAENRMAMSQGLTNGKLTRDMLVGILDSGDLSKKRGSKGAVDETASDFEFVQMLLKQFPKPPEPKAVVVKDNTSKQPGTSSDTTKSPTAPPTVSTPPISKFKPPTSNFKIPNYAKQFPKLNAKNDSIMKSGADRAATQIRKDVLRGNLPYNKAREALESLGMGDRFVKSKMSSITHYAEKLGMVTAQSPNANALQPTVSPDDKMNKINSIQKENLAATTQPGSPIMISSSDNSTKIAPMEQTIMMEDKIHNSLVPTGVQR